MKISLVIPVRDGERYFSSCLSALRCSSRQPDEIIVVNDGSADRSVEIAELFGAHVVEIESGPKGPAVARNKGVLAAQGDIILFIDADVVVHEDAIERVEKTFLNNPRLSALFGSYDDQPPHRELIPLYKNLQHHFVHQNSSQEATTFWAGCGAVRREIFLEMGGFNSLYDRPSIEDIEFGYRMHQAGHQVWLCADIQVTHLKCWTFSSWLRTDIFDRAVPWSRLILSSAKLPKDLNLNIKNRVSAVAAWMLMISLNLILISPLALFGAVLSFLGLLYLNFSLFQFFFRQGGLWFTLGAILLTTLYYLYSSAAFGLIWLEHRFLQKAPDNPVDSGFQSTSH